VATLFGVGGPHGEGIFFGILIGLPFNIFAYYWLTIQVIKRFFPDISNNVGPVKSVF
jgi:hypothetical protein